jgi:glutamine amidotransferase
LGLLAGHVERLAVDRVPRLGWALVEPWNEAFYFAHSYHVVDAPSVATSEGIAVAIAAGSFFGVQFHPEKSARAGEELLRRCL